MHVESLIENWFNPNELLSLNKDLFIYSYLIIYLFIYTNDPEVNAS